MPCLRRYACDARSAQLGRVFAVFDGHGAGGDVAAEFACSQLLRLAEARAAAEVARLAESGRGDLAGALADALKNAFADCEEAFAAASRSSQLDARGGTVALLACVLPESRTLLVAWAGDSTALLRSAGRTHRCVSWRGAL